MTAGTEPPDPRYLSLLRHFIILVGKAELAVTVVALLVSTTISMVQIAMRYSTGYSIWWAQEVSILLMLVVYFVGGAVVYRHRYDIVVGYFVDKLPDTLRNILFLATQLLVLTFWLTVAWQIYLMIPQGMRTFTPIMRLPKAYGMLPVLYAALSISLVTLWVMLDRLHAGLHTGSQSLDDVDNRLRDRLGGEI